MEHLEKPTARLGRGLDENLPDSPAERERDAQPEVREHDARVFTHGSISSSEQKTYFSILCYGTHVRRDLQLSCIFSVAQPRAEQMSPMRMYSEADKRRSMFEAGAKGYNCERQLGHPDEPGRHHY
jgi:hypothetical protein